MTSENQLQANRRNSTKSTGPKTRAGKAQSRLNSCKHGLTAKLLITAGENGADFDQLRAELLEEFHAKSALRIELVDRLAGILWRLRRVPFFEAAILAASNAEISEKEGGYWNYEVSEESDDEADEKNQDEEPDWEASVQLGKALIEDARWNDALGKLARHETTLMNAFTKTLQMLLLLETGRSDQNRDETNDLVIEAAAPPPRGH